ncbi:MAG: hypothetical protein FWG93_05615, partial [Oscillospiraceae bacterium]|nr:hypothetical protein [Oscillospiraceae bacterium]
FVSREDPVTGDFEDTGYWALTSGGGPAAGPDRLCLTRTLRPRRALARVRQEDSTFDALQTPALYRYPSGRRVRWDEFTLEAPAPDDYAALIAAAEPLSSAARRLREALRDPLDRGAAPAVVRMDALETAGDRFWLVCGDARLPLADAPDAPVSLLPLMLSASHRAAFVLLRAAPDGSAAGEVLSLISDTAVTRMGG